MMRCSVLQSDIIIVKEILDKIERNLIVPITGLLTSEMTHCLECCILKYRYMYDFIHGMQSMLCTPASKLCGHLPLSLQWPLSDTKYASAQLNPIQYTSGANMQHGLPVPSDYVWSWYTLGTFHSNLTFHLQKVSHNRGIWVNMLYSTILEGWNIAIHIDTFTTGGIKNAGNK
jgi:hypothetical protein